MFQALGGTNFSIGKAWESLEQLVAPIPEDEEPQSTVNDSVEDEGDDDNGFESAILQHINSKRQELHQHDMRKQADPHELVPDSPSSLTTITLDDDDRSWSAETPPTMDFVKSFITPAIAKPQESMSSPTAFISNAELEKSVQARYREQLENEVHRFEKRTREQRESFEKILNNAIEERDFYKKKAQIDQTVDLSTTVQDQQQEIIDLQTIMKDLSAKLHSALEEKAEIQDKCKKLTKENQHLLTETSSLTSRLEIVSTATTTTPTNPLALSTEEQRQLIEQLNKQLEAAAEESVSLKSHVAMLSKENESLVVELSDKDLEIQKLQSSSSFFEASDDRNTSQNTAMKQLLEESERANDALRTELSALRLEHTNATIDWERSKAALEKQLVARTNPNEALRHEIERLQQETQRLEAALTESENLLKEAEEMAWKHKAEAAEILYAYQSDEERWKKDQERWKAMEVEWQQKVQQLTSTASSATTEQSTTPLSPTVEAAVVPPLAAEPASVLAAEAVTKQEVAEFVMNLARQLSLQSDEREGNDRRIVLPTCSWLPTELSTALSTATTKLLQEAAASHRWQQQLAEAEKLCRQHNATLDRLGPLLTSLADVAAGSNGVTSHSSNSHSAAFTADDLFAQTTRIDQRLQAYQVQEKSLQAELQRVKADLAVQQELHQRGTVSTSEQLQDTRTKLTTAEDENRKLHQVIAQLRSLRRAKDGEEQSAQQELQHLRSLQQSLTRENDELKRFAHELDTLKPQWHSLQTQYADLLAVNTQLEEALLVNKRSLAEKEQQCYDQLTTIDVLQAEQRLLQQEINLRTQEIDNLNDALAHIDREHATQLQSLRRQVQDTEASKEAYAQQIAAQQAEQWKISLVDAQRRTQALTQQYEDAELRHRQQQLQWSQEKQTMQRTLANTIESLQHSSRDVIDRTLMANLLVQYFQRKKSKEILQLIARMLQLTDEQMIVVGLRGAPVDLVNTLLTTVIGPTAPVQVEGDNLAELWVNYLINQASNDDISSRGRASTGAGGGVGNGNGNVNGADGKRAALVPEAAGVSSSVPSTPRRATGQSGGLDISAGGSSHGSGSNFHSLPASPASHVSSMRGSPDTAAATTTTISSTATTASGSGEDGGQKLSTGSASASASANQPPVTPEEVPLGGFLGAATSLLTFWRR